MSADPTRAAWLASRRFGSSDCGRLLSGQYGGAWGVYVDHAIGGTDTEDPGLADRKAMEPFILDRARLRLGWDVTAHGDRSLTHPTETWASCTPDAFRVVDGKRLLVELKTTDVMMAHTYGRDGAEVGDGDMPDYVRFQVAHQSWIVQALGLVEPGSPAYVLTLDGHFRLRHFVVPHDDALEAFIVERCKAFLYDHIEARVPPPVDGSDGCDDAIKAAHPFSTRPDPIDLPGEAADLVEAYLDAKAEMDAAELRKKAAQQSLQLLLGDAAAGRVDGAKIGWGNCKGRTSFDSGRFEADYPEIARDYFKIGAPYRRFTVTPKKETQ